MAETYVNGSVVFLKMAVFLRYRTTLWNQRINVLILLSWLLVVAGAFLWLSVYAATPGQSGNSPQRWPQEISVDLPHAGPTLMMFAHPRCPCTRASLRELALILASCPGFRHVHVIFFRPDVARTDWLQSDIVRQAEAMTGVHVMWDPEGRLAGRFGAQTSGHVMLYDELGNLKFSGGITAVRGHEGWNRGRETLISIGRGEQRKYSEQRKYKETPVFGCSLRCPDDSRNVADRNFE